MGGAGGGDANPNIQCAHPKNSCASQVFMFNLPCLSKDHIKLSAGSQFKKSWLGRGISRKGPPVREGMSRKDYCGSGGRNRGPKVRETSREVRASTDMLPKEIFDFLTLWNAAISCILRAFLTKIYGTEISIILLDHCSLWPYSGGRRKSNWGEGGFVQNIYWRATVGAGGDMSPI